MTADPALTHALQSICPAGACGAAGYIAPGDATRLLPEEADVWRNAVPRVRDASGAARHLARGLLSAAGVGRAALPKGPGGAPVWPPGIVGSLSHATDAAAAVVARADHYACIGVDIEQPGQDEPGVAELVVREDERWAVECGLHAVRQIFSIKEAVFKALFPRDRVMLDFHAVRLDFAACSASTSYGASAQWRTIATSHICSVAWHPRG